MEAEPGTKSVIKDILVISKDEFADMRLQREK